MIIGDDKFIGFFSMPSIFRKIFPCRCLLVDVKNATNDNNDHLTTFERELLAAVDTNAVSTIFNQMPGPINLTDIETVQKFCIETIKSGDVNDDVLQALAGFRGFCLDAIPNFVFTSGLECGQQEHLTQIFLDSGYRPKIIGIDHIPIPLSVTKLVFDKLSQDTCDKHGTKEVMPHYYRHRPGPEFNNNGQITADGCSVECNVITEAFREIEQHDEKKFFLKKMERVPTATELFEGGIRSTLLANDNKTKFGPNVQFGFSQFGALVYALVSPPANSLNEGDTLAFRLTCRNLKKGTGHAMTLYLRKEGRMLKIYLHDPNVTANMKHLSLPFGDKMAISKLDFQNFVRDKQALSVYCEDSETLSIGGVTEDFAKAHAGKFVSGTTRLSSIGDALCMGNSTHIDAIAGQFSDKSALATYITANIAILKQALYYALQDGHGDAIRAFARLLAIAEIKEKDLLAELLTAKRYDGTPGLYMALQKGQTDAILAFAELLAIVNIPNPDRRADLVTDKDSDGTSGFYSVFWYEQTKDVSAYGVLLKSADLNETRQDELLMPKDRVTGILGIDIALRRGYSGTIRAFGAVLKSLGITDKERLNKLLMPMSSLHVAARKRAKEKGHIDAIKAYDELFQAPLPADEYSRKTVL